MSDCDCDEATSVVGARVHLNLRVVNVTADYQASDDVDVIVVQKIGVTVTLPENAAPGKSVRVLAAGSFFVTVKGGCFPLCDAMLTSLQVPACRSADFTFSGGCEGVWVGSAQVQIPD